MEKIINIVSLLGLASNCGRRRRRRRNLFGWNETYRLARKLLLL